MLARGGPQVSENDALLSQRGVNLVVNGLVIDERQQAALFLAEQRLAVFRRDVLKSATVGGQQHAGAVPINVAVIGAAPRLVLGRGHGQRFVQLPGLQPHLAQPIRFVIALAQGFDVGAGERGRRKFACNTTTSCHW